MSPPLSYTFLALLIINQGLVYYIINLIGLQLATLYLGRYKFKIYRYTYVHILTTDIPTISHWNGHSGTAVDVNHNKKFRMTAASAAPCNAWWVKISKNVQFGGICSVFPIFLLHYFSIFKVQCAMVLCWGLSNQAGTSRNASHLTYFTTLGS